MSSLRTRLVVVTSVLIAAVLLVVSAGLYLAVETYLRDAAEERTRSAPLFGPDRGDDGPAGDPDDDDRAGPDDDVYVFVRRADGSTAEQPAQLDGGRLVTLELDFPDPLPPPDDDPDGAAVFRTVETDAGPFLVKFSVFENGDVLAVGVSTAAERTLLRRLLATSLIVSIGAIVVASLAAAWTIRRGLRPLTKVAEAAHRITAGDIEHRIEVSGDPSEIREVGDSLNTMLDRLNDAVDQAQEGELRMRSFVADASHELRTPVAAIGAYAELFDRGAAERPDDLARAMRGIDRETRRAARLIEDLTILARPADQAGDTEDVDLATLLADAVETATTIDPRWPLTLALRAEPVVVGDPVALRRVIDNVLANVRTHTPPGTRCALDVELDRERAVAVVRATDDGPGLTDEQLTRATDRFWRSDSSRTRATGGSGLGLAIVRSLVAAHGGTVALRHREPAPGLVVEIRLPAAG